MAEGFFINSEKRALSRSSSGKRSWATLMPMPMMAQPMLPSSPSKGMDRLRQAGWELESGTNRGYRLFRVPDLVTAPVIPSRGRK